MAKSGLLPAATTLLLLLSLSPARTTADMDIDVVLDVEGKPLEVGSEYYIQPVNTGIFRGGIRRTPKPNGSSCPVYAIQSPSQGDKGRPVKFIPKNETQNQIRERSPVGIDSGFNFNCIEDGLWRVNFDATTYLRTVIIASGAFELPRSRFMILKVDEDSLRPGYKITFTPNEASPGPGGPLYKYMTLFTHFNSGMTLLGLTDNTGEALHVEFIKKPVGTTIKSFK